MSNEKSLGQVAYDEFWGDKSCWANCTRDGVRAWESVAQSVLDEAIKRGIVIKPPEVKPQRTPGQRLWEMYVHAHGEDVSVLRWDLVTTGMKNMLEAMAKDFPFPPEPEPWEVLRNLINNHYGIDPKSFNGDKDKTLLAVIARHSNLPAIQAELAALKAKEGK